jgi:hypothetical protein
MVYAVFTTTGKSPTFDDVFNSGKLDITIDKDIKSGIGVIIIKPEEGDEMLISFQLANNRLTGGTIVKKGNVI